jgi:hypothetical protein
MADGEIIGSIQTVTVYLGTEGVTDRYDQKINGESKPRFIITRYWLVFSISCRALHLSIDEPIVV